MPQGLGRNLYASLSVGENLDFSGGCSASATRHGRGESTSFCRQQALPNFTTGRRAIYPAE
jgi:hypothetical protein